MKTQHKVAITYTSLPKSIQIARYREETPSTMGAKDRATPSSDGASVACGVGLPAVGAAAQGGLPQLLTF